jgi:hypothetical protein
MEELLVREESLFKKRFAEQNVVGVFPAEKSSLKRSKHGHFIEVGHGKNGRR